VTSGHSLDRDIDRYLLFLQDLSASDGSQFTARIQHPTFAGDRSADPAIPPNAHTNLGPSQVGADVGMFFSEDALTAPNTSFPQLIFSDDPANSIVGRTDGVQLHGYGDDSVRSVLAGTVRGTRRVTLNARRIGKAYLTEGEFVSGVGKQTAQHGDSGAPLMVNTPRSIAGIHFSRSFFNTSPVSVALALDDFEPWIDVVTRTRGQRIEGDLDGRGRKDQIFFYISGTDCKRHIEFGEGMPLRRVDQLLGPCPRHTGVLGALNGPSLDDVVTLGSLDDSIDAGDGLVRFDVNSASPGTAVLHGSVPYASVEVSHLNYDAFDDVTATATDDHQDFYFGSNAGLSGPFGSQGAASCRVVFSDVQGTNCGAVSPPGDCRCDEACTMGIDCCEDRDAVCGVPFAADPVVAIATHLAGQSEQPIVIRSPNAAAQVNGSGGTGLGVFLDPHWLLTAGSLLGTAVSANSVTVTKDGTTIPILSAMRDPHADARQFGRVVQLDPSDGVQWPGRSMRSPAPTSCPVRRTSRRSRSQSDVRGCGAFEAATSGCGIGSTRAR